MSKYTSEEKEIIEKVKTYLKSIRTLKNEKSSLQLEYENIPKPQSPVFTEAPGGFSQSKDHQLDSYITRRDLLLKRIELFNDEIDKFTPVLYLLKSGQRIIVNCYINSRGYSEMIELLSEHYISERAYSREINGICLELAKYTDYRNPPKIEQLNKEFNEYLKLVKNNNTCN